MKHMDAVNVLRATKQHVKLVVVRRPTGVSSKVDVALYLVSPVGVSMECVVLLSSNGCFPNLKSFSFS